MCKAIAIFLFAPIVQVHAKPPPARWKAFEMAVRSVGKTDRGTVSMTQLRKAVGALRDGVGLSTGQGPVGVERWIKEHLLPQAQETRNEMQAEVDSAATAVESCGNLLWSAEKEVEHRESVLLTDESKKYQCTARAHQLEKTKEEKCSDLSTFAAALRPPASINDAEKTPAAMKEAIAMNHAFYGSAYPQFMTLKSACDGATSASEAQNAECEADEAVIEDFFCKLKEKRDEACAAYDHCYEVKTTALASKIEKVRELEVTTKEHFQSMACAGEAFGEGGEADDECDPHAYETNHLDVSYPATPAKQTCVGIMLQTGRRNYSEIVCDGDGDPGAAEQTTTTSSIGSNTSNITAL